MSDIYCQICSEPWDSYGITYDVGEGDMTHSEARKFKEGRGCPACGFGTLCLDCRGKKIQDNHCPTCYGSGRVLARSMDGSDIWEFGYLPNIQRCAAPDLQDVASTPKRHKCKEGWFTSAWAVCPDCKREGISCPTCQGDGKYRQPQDALNMFSRGLESLLDGTDDPDSILENYL